MRHIIFMLLISVTGHAFADIWKCVSSNGDVIFTADKNEAIAKNCEPVTVSPKAPRAPTAQQTATFRKGLKVGDRSLQGLVVELKPPVALVQPISGQSRWYRIDELVPAL